MIEALLEQLRMRGALAALPSLQEAKNKDQVLVKE